MSYRWKPVYTATLHMAEYAVTGFRLYDDAYYGEDGMADSPSTLPLDEWNIIIESWEPCYTYGGKVAGCMSRTRMKMGFKNRDETNRVWKFIKENEPTYAELEQMGFYRLA